MLAASSSMEICMHTVAWGLLRLSLSLLWIAGLIIVVARFTIAQRQYLRMYRIVHKLTARELPLSEELLTEYTRPSSASMFEIQRVRYDALLTEQSDVDLERLRRRIFIQLATAIAYGMSGLLLLVLFS